MIVLAVFCALLCTAALGFLAGLHVGAACERKDAEARKKGPPEGDPPD